MSSPVRGGGVKEALPVDCGVKEIPGLMGLAAPWHRQGQTVTYQLPLLCGRSHHGRRDFSREQLLACLEEDLGDAEFEETL